MYTAANHLILGYVEAMLSGIADDPENVTKYLELIRSKAAGLNRLINDLFELTNWSHDAPLSQSSTYALTNWS